MQQMEQNNMYMGYEEKDTVINHIMNVLKEHDRPTLYKFRELKKEHFLSMKLKCN